MRTISILLILFFKLSIIFAQSPKKSKKMVIIPGGEFIMGHGENAHHDFHPPHTVKIDSFYMDIHEVTNAQYFEFCQATGHKLPEFWGMDKFRCSLDYPDHPVCGVNWFDAQKYARWAGKRLPTEAEWEYAARGGMAGKEYPWGNYIDSTYANYKKYYKTSTATGRFSANKYGLYDMAGNVWEWTQDRYAANYYSQSHEENPRGPENGWFRVIRGGSWHSGDMCVRGYYRNGLSPNWVDFAVGFRCVKDIQKKE